VSEKKRAIIAGIGGQDGSYLAELAPGEGYGSAIPEKDDDAGPFFRA